MQGGIGGRAAARDLAGHRAGLGGRRGHRLLHQDRAPGLRRPDADAGPLVGRHAHDDRVGPANRDVQAVDGVTGDLAGHGGAIGVPGRRQPKVGLGHDHAQHVGDVGMGAAQQGDRDRHPSNHDPGGRRPLRERRPGTHAGRAISYRPPARRGRVVASRRHPEALRDMNRALVLGGDQRDQPRGRPAATTPTPSTHARSRSRSPDPTRGEGPPTSSAGQPSGSTTHPSDERAIVGAAPPRCRSRAAANDRRAARSTPRVLAGHSSEKAHRLRVGDHRRERIQVLLAPLTHERALGVKPGHRDHSSGA